jgi:hypothetical protein
MKLIITIEQNNETGELSAFMSSELGSLEIFRKPDGNQCVIWDQPDRTGKNQYIAALKKQKDKSRLRSI